MLIRKWNAKSHDRPRHHVLSADLLFAGNVLFTELHISKRTSANNLKPSSSSRERFEVHHSNSGGIHFLYTLLTSFLPRLYNATLIFSRIFSGLKVM